MSNNRIRDNISISQKKRALTLSRIQSDRTKIHPIVVETWEYIERLKRFRASLGWYNSFIKSKNLRSYKPRGDSALLPDDDINTARYEQTKRNCKKDFTKKWSSVYPT